MTNIASLDDLLTPFQAHASLGEADLLYKQAPKTAVNHLTEQPSAVGVTSSPAYQRPSRLDEELAYFTRPLTPRPTAPLAKELQTREQEEIETSSGEASPIFEAMAVEAPVVQGPPHVVSLGLVEEVVDLWTPQERHPEQALVKRVSDIIFSMVGLALTAPLFAWMAFLSKKTAAQQPIWAHDEYVGQFQQRFGMRRFAIFDALDSAPFLVRASHAVGLGHLPKLLNLYEGTVSLVGPTLLKEGELNALPARYAERFQVLPGVFGLAQVLTRFYPQASLQAVAELDLEYVRRWNVFLDLALLWSHAVAKNPHQQVAKQLKPREPRRFQITVTY
jgi:lipopolysaccharide/colanic/teichoic acid biosynthesis glycosyltransferase